MVSIRNNIIIEEVQDFKYLGFVLQVIKGNKRSTRN